MKRKGAARALVAQVCNKPMSASPSALVEPPDEDAGLESEVTVTITSDGEVTDLVIRHEKLTRPGAGIRHAEGWHGALDQLGAILEATGRWPIVGIRRRSATIWPR